MMNWINIMNSMDRISEKSDFPSSDFRSRDFKGNWVKHFINQYVDTLNSEGINITQKKFSNYKCEHLPQSLYKFMSPSIYSFINLHQQSISLSYARNFNDPFDSYACINKESFVKFYLLKKLKEKKYISEIENMDSISQKEYWDIFYSNCEEDNNLIRDHFWTVLNKICKTKSSEFSLLINDIRFDAMKECESKMEYIRNLLFRISCFSNFDGEDELMENTTMWSHYADNHRGFCVKYKLNFDNIKYKDKILCGLFPVNYTSKTQKISPRELYKLRVQDNRLELNQSVQKTVLKSLTTKSKFWSYEKEWRLILNENDASLLYNNIMPFLKVDAIYLGCRIEANLKKFITNFAEDNGIEIFQTKQRDEKFSLSSYNLDTKSLQWDEFREKMWQIRRINDKQEQSSLIHSLYEEDFPK